MRLATLRLLFLLFCAFCFLPANAVEGALEGTWVGGFALGEHWVFIKAHFRTEDGAIKGAVDIPLEFAMGQPLTRINLDAARVHFELARPAGTLVFDAQLKDGTISGEVEQAGQRSTFQLTRIAQVNPANYVGTYQLAPDRFISIRQWVELDPSTLQFTDSDSGRFGTLFPLSETTFFSGPAFLITYPIEVKVTFGKNAQGEVTGLIWQQSGAPELSGTKIKFKEEEVSFQNGDVTLAGTLILPATPAPHPAIVMTHGSGPQPRAGERSLAEFFARHGIAALIYDKRGVGASTGDWRQASFADLAADALAGVQLLKTRKDINPTQIGLWGASQGGWIGPLAASRSTDVAFVISQSGPGVSPQQQEFYRVEHWLRADGFSEEDIQEAIAFMKLTADYVRSGQGWEQLAAAAQKIQDKAWWAYLGGLPPKDHWVWQFFRLISDYDPVPALEKLTCPVLAIFGELDTYVPVAASVAIWEKALKKAANQDYTIQVFPKGDHSLIEVKTGGLKEAPYLKRFVPGYFDTLSNWLRKRLLVPK